MKTVFVDVDTQLDFLYPSGALYVPGAEHIVPAVARLNRHAAAHGISIVSTMDAHTEDDVEFRVWPPHCIAGTLGQHKAEATLDASRIVIPNRPCELAIEGVRQILVEKQTVDVWQAANLARVFDRLEAERFVVYGVVTEICVRYTAMGLLKAGKQVVVVTDAIAALKREDSERTLQEVCVSGGALAGLDQVLQQCV
ncbi:MAG TPA: isochorismatase family protein [Bryobacteraceae bacterium]|nr:isochorismatase family protein [Bryobacteraceae bacterium]